MPAYHITNRTPDKIARIKRLMNHPRIRPMIEDVRAAIDEELARELASAPARKIEVRAEMLDAMFIGTATSGIRLCKLELRDDKVYFGSVPTDCCFVGEIGDERLLGDDEPLGAAVDGHLRTRIIETNGRLRVQVPNGPVLEWMPTGWDVVA